MYVILHTFPDGTKKLIAFASRSPTNTEKNYTQLEKEASLELKSFISICTDKFPQLVTDHKPLTAILGPKKALAAAQLQRWAVLLSAYQYDIQL